MTGIVEIKIGNEVKQLKFNQYALEKYTIITNSEIGNIKQLSEDYTQLDMIADVVYCGLFGYYRSKGLVVDFTLKDIQMQIEDISYVEQLTVIREFMNSVVDLTNDMLNAFKLMAGNSQEEKKK